MTDPTNQPQDQDEEQILAEVSQLLRDEFDVAMKHELDGALGSPKAIMHLPRHIIRAEMNQFIIRLQAQGLDRMARSD